MTMANYETDPNLYHQVLTGMEICFPGIKSLADKGRKYDAAWDRFSIPFVVTEDNEVIAHVGIISFDFIINNENQKGAAIHGVYVKDEYRGKGFFKELMEEALDFSREHYDFSLLFTDQPHLYHKFGFKTTIESDFVLNSFNKKPTSDKLHRIDLKNKAEIDLMHHLLMKRLPLSLRFGILHEKDIFTLQALQEPIYYSPIDNALIYYKIIDDVLYIRDIVCEKIIPLSRVIDLIPETFSEVILQFSPERFTQDVKPIRAHPECSLMVSESVELGDKPMRFPEGQRC